ncbi:MAG: UDP-4-amino-4,6-dideoxy-N-acetyl-beta-L-altrosamine transaminase [Oceanobacter sp.]|nr:MAG: UDP-4-amino-4,6-dideoxy-N-acetyl-beta-L-altrosamine transaminase [Oceanobacter sp.]
MIPYGKQDISAEDIAAVSEVLRSDFLTQGPVVPKFEKAVTEAVKAKYGVAVNSATSALHIACLALGVGPGDRVWTSPVTFVASANCALYCGADISFVDIDPDTYNLCPKALEQKLIVANDEGTLPKVIIPVHLAGQSCDMEAIAALARQYDIRVIEDASHAIGADYAGDAVGSCRFSDITVFSFHPVKIVTTAEGGVAVTNNLQLAERMQRLRSHGITRDPELMTKAPDGAWYYQQIELGFNYRMTEMQAALGLSQMQRLSLFVERRRGLAKRYNELLSDLPVTLPQQLADSASSWHLYIVRFHLEKIEKTHSQIFDECRAAGIGVNLHYIPIHLQPYYSDLGFKQGDYPAAEAYYANAISIPLFHSMTDAQQDEVVRVVKEIVL